MIRRRTYGRNHSYVNDRNERVPQVSGIVKAGVDKSGPLTAWTARITADYVLDHWDELAAMPLSGRYWTVRGVAQRHKNEAAAKGTRIHAVLDKLSAGETVEYDPSMEADVQAGLNFLEDFGAVSVMSERTVWSETYGYAGTFDTIKELATGPDDDVPALMYETWGLDYKRTGGVYPENALQLEGYFSAEWLMSVAGSGALVAERMPEVDHIGIVHLNAEYPRGYRLIPVPDNLREELFEYFRYAQHMAHFAEVGQKFLGEPIEPPTWDDEESA